MRFSARAIFDLLQNLVADRHQLRPNLPAFALLQVMPCVSSSASGKKREMYAVRAAGGLAQIAPDFFRR